MPLDPAANFVRDALQSGVTDTDTTLSVSDAAQFPDPATDGEYNVVVWDAANNPRPDQDPDVEIVRVTAVDTSANELTVTRAQENTTAASHPVESGVLLAPTAKDTSDTVAALNARPESPVGGDDLADGLDTGASSRIGGTTYLNSHDSLEAVEKVHNGVVYADHPDFSTVQDALDYADSNGYGEVLLGSSTYSPNNIPSGISIRGTSTDPFGNGSTLTLDGTFSAARVSIRDVVINNSTGSTTNLDFTTGSIISHCGLINSESIDLSGDDIVFVANGCRGGEVTVSGDDNVIRGNTDLAVTDTGANNSIGGNT